MGTTAKCGNLLIEEPVSTELLTLLKLAGTLPSLNLLWLHGESKQLFMRNSIQGWSYSWTTGRNGVKVSRENRQDASYSSHLASLSGFGWRQRNNIDWESFLGPVAKSQQVLDTFEILGIINFREMFLKPFTKRDDFQVLVLFLVWGTRSPVTIVFCLLLRLNLFSVWALNKSLHLLTSYANLTGIFKFLKKFSKKKGFQKKKVSKKKVFLKKFSKTFLKTFLFV